MIDSFLLWFTYCDGRKRESDRTYLDAYSLVTFLPVFHTVTTGNVFLCLTMIQKRKNIKTLGSTNQIASSFNALSIACSLYKLLCYKFVFILFNVCLQNNGTFDVMFYFIYYNAKWIAHPYLIKQKITEYKIFVRNVFVTQFDWLR
jgi:hypothetical protein